MIIRHFNTDLLGGAGVAARRLHQGLLSGKFHREPIESHFHCQSKYQDTNLAASIPNCHFHSAQAPPRYFPYTLLHKKFVKKTSRLYDQHIALRPSGRELFSLSWELNSHPSFASDWKKSILHLHWVSFWLDQSQFLKSAGNRPIVWTLHDMNAITGGCHHADECLKFHTSCESCPQLASPGPSDAAAFNFARKAKAFQKANLHLVTPSRWMEQNVRASHLGKMARSVRTIRNALDWSQFQPTDKMAARKKFGLHPQKFTLGFGAANLENPRKGLSDLLEALKRLPEDVLQNSLQILFFGKAPEGFCSDDPRITFFPIGFVDSAEVQRQVYSALDLFILPSWAENMPQTAIESLACQTPVLGYEIGGIPEIVKHEETGLLAKHCSAEDLAEKIAFAADRPQLLETWGKNGRDLVCKEFSAEHSCKQYIELYQSLH